MDVKKIIYVSTTRASPVKSWCGASTLSFLVIQWAERRIFVVRHHELCIMQPQAYLWEVCRSSSWKLLLKLHVFIHHVDYITFQLLQE